MNRMHVLDALAERIGRLQLGRPARIAIDGRTASGKTTLADELAARLIAQGRPVIRTSIDGFHKPRAERYARGRHSADGYYYDARDLAAVVALLLAPLGPGGDRLYRTASFDLEGDRAIEQEPQIAVEDAILIVDGTFLQRPELSNQWDATVFVRTSVETSEARGLCRDMERLGGEEAARELYARRYHPAYTLYERLSEPERRSDAIIDNDGLTRPQLHVRAQSRLA